MDVEPEFIRQFLPVVMRVALLECPVRLPLCLAVSINKFKRFADHPVVRVNTRC